MSYILEALKKSERERARGNIPTLDTVSRHGMSRTALWLGALLGAGTLAIVAALAWFVHAQFFPTPAPTVGTGSDGSGDAPQQAVATAVQPNAAVRVQPAGADTDRVGATTGGGSRRVADISELDADARRRIQSLSVNVVSYSDDPARRFVMLNQRIVHESEVVGANVVVKRITPQGALLSVGDYEILVAPE